MKTDSHSVKVSTKVFQATYSFLNGFFMYMRCMR
jgi:hypothetical protein